MERQGGRIPFYLSFYIPSLVAGMGFFYCFYRFGYQRWGPRVGIVSLVSLIAYPVSFYHLTAFPYNYTLLCMSGYMLVYDSKLRGRMLWLGLLAFYCSLTYPSAIVFAIYPLGIEVEKMYRTRRLRILPAIYYGSPFALAVLAFYLHLYSVRGDFLAYLNHQSGHFQRNFSNPLEAVLVYFRELPLLSPENITALYILFFLALFACRKLGLALWCYVIMLIAFSPLTGSFQCVYRHYLLAFPMHYMFGLSDKRRSVKVPFVVLCLYLGLRPFFAYYIKGQLT
jgi:hypothetical protein